MNIERLSVHSPLCTISIDGLYSSSAGSNGGERHRHLEESTRVISIIHQSPRIPLPVFSIIVPTFQEEKLLHRCLSIFAPERKERYRFEVIVSDGGSKDRTIEIARDHADTVVQYSGSGKQGIAEGRNVGAQYARGRVFMFLNGDTIPEDPDRFLSFVQQWGEGKGRYAEAPALACWVDVFPEERIWKDILFYGFHNRYVRLLNWIGIGMCRGECQIISRAAFEREGGYNGRLKAGEDFELYTRLSRHGRIPFFSHLRVMESPRRFRAQGYLPILYLWTINSVAVKVFHHSYSDDWPDVR